MPAATTAALRSHEFPFFIDPLSGPYESKASQSSSVERSVNRASLANECHRCQPFFSIKVHVAGMVDGIPNHRVGGLEMLASNCRRSS
jgi:hypothetical protein